MNYLFECFRVVEVNFEDLSSFGFELISLVARFAGENAHGKLFLSKKALAILNPRKPVAPAIKTVLNWFDISDLF